MRVFDEHWDNGKFHKAFTWVRPENEVALALLRRYGYEQSGAAASSSIFGQDYVVMEKFYTKVTEDYDSRHEHGPRGALARRGWIRCWDARAGALPAWTTATPAAAARIDTSTPASRRAVSHIAADQTVCAASAATAAPIRPSDGTSSRLPPTSTAIPSAIAGSVA